MLIESKFSKLFLLKIFMGFVVFVFTLYFFIQSVINAHTKSKISILVFTSFTLIFLIYLSSDVLKIFQLKISVKNIYKVNMFTKNIEIIPFESITNFKQKTITPKNTRGQINNSYNTYFVYYNNNKKSFIISPNYFENHKEIVLAIKNSLKKV